MWSLIELLSGQQDFRPGGDTLKTFNKKLNKLKLLYMETILNYEKD